MAKPLSKSAWVQPLWRAQNYFLQVLLTHFNLTKQGGGVKLQVDFDRETNAIWSNPAKGEILKHIPDFHKRACEYQRELDHILLGGSGDMGRFGPFHNPSFPFRYVSGGTLPILTIGRRQYYCLFYREVYPIGWNIANGGADSFHELLDPLDAVRRELGEELLIVNPKDKQRYVFEWDTSELVDWPGFSVARRLFQQQYPDLNLGACEELLIKPEWRDGPDSLWISYEQEEPRLTTDCFVNINATDFGIEVDRVANIPASDKAIIFDGEISNEVPVGAPIGLFPVEELNAIVDRANAESDGSNEPANTRTTAFPKSFFYDAKPYGNAQDRLPDLIRDVYIRRLRRKDVLSDGEVNAWQKAEADDRAYGLCPVTHAIISRLLKYEREQAHRSAEKRGPFDFFLCYATPDEDCARTAYDHLTNAENRLCVFFDKRTPQLTRFADEIRAAIDASRGMIVIATRPEHLRREGVMYEWVTFLNARDEGRKLATSPFINFVSNISYDDLPTQMSRDSAVKFNPSDMGPGLSELSRFIQSMRRQ
jgi:hypothetical protein